LHPLCATRTHVGVEPDLDGLGGEAAVALAYDESPAGPEHPAHLLEHLERLIQVVHAHDARDYVEGVVGEGELRVLVEVLRHILRELLVLGKLKLVHPEPY
jgi:hypothetical protein